MHTWFSLVFDPAIETAHVFLRDDIGCGGVQTSGTLSKELARLAPKRVELDVDSSGGCSICGLNLCQIFRQYHTTARIIGKAYSSALIATLGAREIRILPTASILIHSPAAFVFGDAEDLLVEASKIRKLRAGFAAALTERTEQPVSMVNEWLARDTWLTPVEAVAAGICDCIESIPEAAPAARTASDMNSPNCPAGRTDAERLFLDFVRAFGPLEVSDPERFREELFQWVALNLRQTNPETLWPLKK